MKRNFNFEHGKVGTWKGTDVIVLRRKEFEAMDRSAECIYALSTGDDSSLMLVWTGYIVGTMDPYGKIVEFGTRQKFEAETAPAAQSQRKEEEKKLPKVEKEMGASPSQELDLDKSLLELSRKADAFLEQAIRVVDYMFEGET